MAAPASYPLLIVIGDTKTVNVSFENPDGTPIDITGRTYAAQIRSSKASTTVLAEFTCTVANGPGGQLAAALPASTTAGLIPSDGVWSLRETNATVVTTILSGTVQIIQSPTR